VSALLAPGMMLIFSGRRWLVEAVHPEDKTVLVRPAKGGTPPRFGGDPGEIHDRVIAEMFALWEGEACPVYLDPTAARMLEGARAEFARLGMDRRDRVQTGAESALLATRVGTVKTSALALALRAMGLEVETHDGLLSVTRPRDGPVLTEALRHLSGQATPELFAGTGPLMVEKFHPYLTPELLQADALSARLDAGAVAGLAARLLA
jgi:ATP-dependent Lhr-like helicase